MPADGIQEAFGPPADVLRKDGKVRGLTYPCENAEGEVMHLRMVFSAEGRLEDWALKDPKAPEPARAS
jgi:hypothetical protein